MLAVESAVTIIVLVQTLSPKYRVDGKRVCNIAIFVTAESSASTLHGCMRAFMLAYQTMHHLLLRRARGRTACTMTQVLRLEVCKLHMCLLTVFGFVGTTVRPLLKRVSCGLFACESWGAVYENCSLQLVRDLAANAVWLAFSRITHQLEARWSLVAFQVFHVQTAHTAQVAQLACAARMVAHCCCILDASSKVADRCFEVIAVIAYDCWGQCTHWPFVICQIRRTDSHQCLLRMHPSIVGSSLCHHQRHVCPQGNVCNLDCSINSTGRLVIKEV